MKMPTALFSFLQNKSIPFTSEKIRNENASYNALFFSRLRLRSGLAKAELKNFPVIYK